jgi:Coenzyme PQQ synthesis protein D (PqqD)
MLRLSEQVRSTHSHDGGIVLDIRHGQMFRLNLVGSRMLELLRLGHSETRIASEISQEFGASPAIIEADLREFLIYLQEHHLLELRPALRQSAL